MKRPQGRWPHWVLLWTAILSGCQPRHPWYLTQREDLASYVDTATSLAYPDVDRPSLDEVTQAQAPMTIDRPDFQSFWDLPLQEAIQIALQNSKVIRTIGSVRTQGVPDALLAQPLGVGTIYDPASVESDPNFGVEAALSAFDAQFSNSLFWETTDRPQNRLPVAIPGTGVLFTPTLAAYTAVFNAEISKRSATGTQFFFRNITNYNQTNAGGAFQPLPSFFTTQFETEVRQPILRGNGARVNRVPILLARIRTDVSLADFEVNVRNLVQDVENAYWELYCTYQILETVKAARDSTLLAWDINHARQVAGVEIPGSVTIGELEAQARNQYFSFRFQTELALNDLYNAETNLRWLMGLTASDGRLVRPIDEPTTARVEFDWYASSSEALVRSPELRRIKWFIKQRELEQIVARNQLLPDLNAVALYRWVGVGDELINPNRNGLNFPAVGSDAFDVLTEGDFQESRVGFDFGFPVGFRLAYSQVRNAQLNLAREHARLEDGELNVSNALAQAMRNMHAQYAFAQSHLNAVIAATQETRISIDRVRGGLNIYTDNALRAIQRQADSQRLFYRAVCEYNKNIALVHYRKNSLLEYDGVYLTEGPWPEKAYFDAEGQARRRAASHYLDYGWTQPPPVAIGPVPSGPSDVGIPGGAPAVLPAAPAPVESVPLPQPTPESDPMANAPASVLPAATAAAYPPSPALMPVPSGMSYRGLGAPVAAPAHYLAPTTGPSSRRDIAPASFIAPVEMNPANQLQRLPVTGVAAP